SIKIKDYEVAYNLLSKDSKENVSLEKFEEYQDTLFKLQTLKDYKLGEENKVEKYKYSNKEYTNLVKIKETDTIKYITENKEDTANFDRYFIIEDNEYKLLWHKDFKRALSSNYVKIARSETEKDEDKDYNKAAIDIKKAIEIDDKNPLAYYTQSYIYIELQRYDEALKSIDKYLEYLDKNNEAYKIDASDAYNLRGVIFMSKSEFNKARESYNKALELNPDNEYAKTNLNDIKGL
ncbi:tetratricopeptide repeat protein, partial [Clostridioides difficile]